MGASLKVHSCHHHCAYQRPLMSDPVPQTDVSRPSALPTADLLNRQRKAAAAAIAHDSDAYLDAIEEEWNKKVDVDVETLVDGMVDLVGLASVGLWITCWQWRFPMPLDLVESDDWV